MMIMIIMVMMMMVVVAVVLSSMAFIGEGLLDQQIHLVTVI